MKTKLILLCLLLSACGQHTGRGTQLESCINGVVCYNAMSGGIAPAFKQDGTLYICEEK
jgi:hypothetical protein